MPTTSPADDEADDDANGRVALVTGASRPHGLGVAVARERATHGFHTVLAGRDLEQTRLRAGELSAVGLAATAVRIDLSDPATITGAAARLGADFGRLDALGTQRRPDTRLGHLPSAGCRRRRRTRRLRGVRLRPVGAHPGLPASAGGGPGGPGRHRVQRRRDAGGILVNSVDPGQFASHPEWGEDNNERPTVESARWVAWAAMPPAGGPTGMLFEDGVPVEPGALAP